MKDRFEELAEIWLKRAKDDVLWVQHDYQGKFYGMVCFGCQQIGEKALKAYLFSQRAKLVRTHDLEQLLEKALVFDKSFFILKNNCQVLTRYYTDTRYPDIWDYARFDNRKLAQEAIKLAEQILQFVKKKV